MSMDSAREKLEALEGRVKQLLAESKQRRDASKDIVAEAREAGARARDAAAEAREASDRVKASTEAFRDAAEHFRAELDSVKGALAAVRGEQTRVEATSRVTPVAHNLRRKWAVPVTQPLVLISQVERSGGTLLVRLFDAHPECFVHPHELKWGQPKFHWPSFDTSEEVDANALFEQLNADWAVKFLARAGYYKWGAETHPEVLPFVFDLELQRAIFHDMFAKRRPDSRRDVLTAFLTSLFNGWLDFQNLYAGPKKLVTGFLPRALMTDSGADRFFDDYPDGHLLTLVRHPGAWLASASRFRRQDAVDLQDWTASVTASLRARELYPDRVTVIVFEDLVLRTEAVMRLVCDRIGISFDQVLLAPTFNGIPALSDSSFAPVHGIDPKVTTRHLEVLSAEQIAHVEEACMQTYREIERDLSVQQRV